MTDPKTTERTSRGIAGKAAGKAKELAGEALRNEELAREGRLQQSQGDADVKAAKARAEAKQRKEEADLEEEQKPSCAPRSSSSAPKPSRRPSETGLSKTPTKRRKPK